MTVLIEKKLSNQYLLWFSEVREADLMMVLVKDLYLSILHAIRLSEQIPN